MAAVKKVAGTAHWDKEHRGTPEDLSEEQKAVRGGRTPPRRARARAPSSGAAARAVPARPAVPARAPLAPLA